MLLLDKVLDIRGDFSGIGIKQLAFNEPIFLNQSREEPEYPGVMLIEGMAQTAAIIAIRSAGERKRPRAVYFLSIDKCKFLKRALPGDSVEYHMRSLGRRNTVWRFLRRSQG